MNLSFFGLSTDPAHHESSQSADQIEQVAYSQADNSLDEGSEYMDDSLRMTDQAFNLD